MAGEDPRDPAPGEGPATDAADAEARGAPEAPEDEQGAADAAPRRAAADEGAPAADALAAGPEAERASVSERGPAPDGEPLSARGAEPASAAAPPPAEPLDEKARRRAELESFLGPKVRTPVGIPLGYQPNDRSIHPLFHVEVGELDFAGPLDLLLYLVRKHDLDVLDIPIAALTAKYLEMLRALEVLEIELAAEFLVLAAELSHIKSKMLLPAEKGVAVEDPPEEAESGDPRAELVRRLLEYQKYRDAALQLADRDQLGRDVFPRMPPPLERLDDLDPGLKQVSVFKLVELMARLLREVPTHHEISYESFSIGERIQYVSAFGEAHGGCFTLQSLMTTIQSRGELVVTFIAILEMGKMGLVRIAVEAFHAGAPVEPGDAEPARCRGEPPPGGGPRAADGELAEGDPETDEAPPSGTAEAEPAADAPASASEEEQPAGAPGDAPLADGADADAARREAEALEALAAEAAAEGPEAFAPVDLPESSDEAPPAEALESLPDIWVELTEKRFQGDLVDDYR